MWKGNPPSHSYSSLTNLTMTPAPNSICTFSERNKAQLAVTIAASSVTLQENKPNCADVLAVRHMTDVVLNSCKVLKETVNGGFLCEMDWSIADSFLWGNEALKHMKIIISSVLPVRPLSWSSVCFLRLTSATHVLVEMNPQQMCAILAFPLVLAQ